MNDKDKLKLISHVLVDFLEFSTPEQAQNGAIPVLNTILSIIDYEDDACIKLKN